MSVDRYLAVVHPLRSRRYRTPRHAVVACLAIWLACAVIMLPVWLYSDVDAGGNGCQIRWPPGSKLAHVFFWDLFEFLVGFAGPIVVMGVGYWRLLRGLLYAARTVTDPSDVASSTALSQRSSVRSASERTRRQMKHVTATVLAVTTAFVICWTPSHVVRFMSLHKQWKYAAEGAIPTRDDVILFRIFNTIAQALIFASSCCNPFIYCISSSNFSKSLSSGNKVAQSSRLSTEIQRWVTVHRYTVLVPT